MGRFGQQRVRCVLCMCILPVEQTNGFSVTHYGNRLRVFDFTVSCSLACCVLDTAYSHEEIDGIAAPHSFHKKFIYRRLLTNNNEKKTRGFYAKGKNKNQFNIIEKFSI
jgi:hypothetical protein